MIQSDEIAVPAEFQVALYENQSGFSDSEGKPALGLTMLVLKSDEVYAISSLYLDGSVLKFEDSSGAAGVVDANEIDWLRTGEMTSDARSTVVASAARPR